MKRTVKIVKKVLDRLHLNMIRCLLYVNVKSYMKKIVKYYRKKGMDIPDMPRYIYNDTYFDPKDFSMIHIGKGCTISREVMFLLHDYSMHTVYSEGTAFDLKYDDLISQRDKEDNLLVLEPIYLENDVFVGARVTLLPGTYIGHNSIIGTGAVVKGVWPPESILIGNPAQCVGKVSEWLDNKFENRDRKSENVR